MGRGVVIIRPYAAADADAAVAFFARAAAADPTLEAVPAAAWGRFVDASFNRGARDFLCAESEGVMVGLATSTQSAGFRHFRIMVHPDARRGGTASRMLERILAQDEPETPPAKCNCNAAWHAGQAFLAANGFRAERTTLQMQRSGPVAAIDPPAGYRLRPATESEGDDVAWRRLTEIGYAGGLDYTPLTARDTDLFRSEPGFSLTLAERDGAVVGLCHARVWEGDGEAWINSVVVAPEHRGRGLGRALTAAAVGTIAETPDRIVKLHVYADGHAAVAIYRRLGFETTSTVSAWILGR
ncbi:MAG: GNAT family N-acetyltransferase [Planctomycetota bacterium]|nr:GNAT family N-acetyltransferase [Planctomycetota bacterium]